MADQIRIGLIGYGEWPRTAYVPAIRTDGRSTVTAVAAPSDATRQRAAAELGPEVALYPDGATLLAGGSVDAVMIAVSEAAHADAIGAALAAGVPTMYEPPLADTVAATPAMLTAFEKVTAPTHADIELSFLPAVARLTELVAAGRLGEPRQAVCRLSSNWGASGELSSAGHLAPWFIDPLDRVLGRTPDRVLTLDGSGNAAGAQPQCLTLLDYGGAWGGFQSNNGGAAQTRIDMQVVGSAGEATADLMSGEIRVRAEGAGERSGERISGNDWVLEQHPPLQPVLGLPGMHESVRLFLDAVEAGSESADAAGTARLARLFRLGLAAEESKRSGGWEAVS